MKAIIIAVGLVILAAVVAFWTMGAPAIEAPPGVGQACTKEAKVCPDGSVVGRTGPNCEFAACPAGAATSTIGGGGGGGKACTMEAKLCPDGSAVGRTGPNCEFASCPTYTSGVRGNVSLGPTCPVMRDPPEPQCADKPYATAVTVYRAGSSASLVVKNSDASGAFAFSLPPGSYSLVASGGTTFPRCSPVEVTVAPNVYTTTTISCDTGIR